MSKNLCSKINYVADELIKLLGQNWLEASGVSKFLFAVGVQWLLVGVILVTSGIFTRKEMTRRTTLAGLASVPSNWATSGVVLYVLSMLLFISGLLSIINGAFKIIISANISTFHEGVLLWLKMG